MRQLVLMEKRRKPTFLETMKGLISHAQWNGLIIQTNMEDISWLKQSFVGHMQDD